MLKVLTQKQRTSVFLWGSISILIIVSSVFFNEGTGPILDRRPSAGAKVIALFGVTGLLIQLFRYGFAFDRKIKSLQSGKSEKGSRSSRTVESADQLFQVIEPWAEKYGFRKHTESKAEKWLYMKVRQRGNHPIFVEAIRNGSHGQLDAWIELIQGAAPLDGPSEYPVAFRLAIDEVNALLAEINAPPLDRSKAKASKNLVKLLIIVWGGVILIIITELLPRFLTSS
jgi:hypothetical protein